MILSSLQLTTKNLAKIVILPSMKLVSPCSLLTNARGLHTTHNVMKKLRVGDQAIRPLPIGKNVILEGELSTDMITPEQSLFPDATTPFQLFDNVPYSELHILNIKSTRNNTIFTLTDAKGLVSMLHTAGIEGFKKSKKGTNIAGQQTAITFANRILESGVTNVRLRIQGIGPGRSGAIKGIELTDLNVVSITDDTRVSWNPPRPRKPRRI
ncbi:uncharacterized protein LOC108632355 [Ceratina calcarata]|uniref:Uncharacterized protein LOC108632355 n=1 Tax=Ceratina calcarata TaxID=156304 RepID=A0AAJ7JGV7_9HYME|nr:uncharacterized protein LOC108632355 [Ceratina calcarata]